MTRAHASTPGSEDGPPVSHDRQAVAYQQLWFALARSAWSSVVLVPVDPAGSADEAARSLADVGKRLSSGPVTAVTARTLEYGTAVALADLPKFVDHKHLLPASHWPTVEVSATLAEAPRARETKEGSVEAPDGQALAVSSEARLIISIPAVVSQPLGLATAQAADLVVLCVEVGQTRLSDARRTMELIGRERIAGCFLVR
jgi:hypothetical protein